MRCKKAGTKQKGGGATCEKKGGTKNGSYRDVANRMDEKRAKHATSTRQGTKRLPATGESDATRHKIKMAAARIGSVSDRERTDKNHQENAVTKVQRDTGGSTDGR